MFQVLLISRNKLSSFDAVYMRISEKCIVKRVGLGQGLFDVFVVL